MSSLVIAAVCIINRKTKSCDCGKGKGCKDFLSVIILMKMLLIVDEIYRSKHKNGSGNGC